MAQFKKIPPLEDIKEIFSIATGCKFHDEVSWSQWYPVDPIDLLVLQPYIRPSHQKILVECMTGTRTVAALLRQVLRPHGYCIILYQGVSTLILTKEDNKTVEKKTGTIVDWSA